MAAKSLGKPRVIESSDVSRHTTGSNHIWKTSSGNRDLKSHLTVSHRLWGRDKEGMGGQNWCLMRSGPRRCFGTSFAAAVWSVGCGRIEVLGSRGVGGRRLRFCHSE